MPQNKQVSSARSVMWCVECVELNFLFGTEEEKVKTVKKSYRRLDWALLGDSKNRNWGSPMTAVW